jgi:hypothetical protein
MLIQRVASRPINLGGGSKLEVTDFHRRIRVSRSLISEMPNDLRVYNTIFQLREGQ